MIEYVVYARYVEGEWMYIESFSDPGDAMDRVRSLCVSGTILDYMIKEEKLELIP
jgi:hypothetical protein